MTYIRLTLDTHTTYIKLIYDLQQTYIKLALDLHVYINQFQHGQEDIRHLGSFAKVVVTKKKMTLTSALYEILKNKESCDSKFVLYRIPTAWNLVTSHMNLPDWLIRIYTINQLMTHLRRMFLFQKLP